MSLERHFPFENTKLSGHREIQANVHGEKIILREDAIPRSIDRHKLPSGAISSIRPILRGVLGAATEEEGYWSQIDSLARMDPRTAANKLKRAGFGQREVSELLVRTDPVVAGKIAWDELTKDQVEAMIDEVSLAIEYLFKSPSRRKGK